MDIYGVYLKSFHSYLVFYLAKREGTIDSFNPGEEGDSMSCDQFCRNMLPKKKL
jgi:hypothetical protein